MASELVRELIDAGIHFGHRASRWNPKMKPFIFGRRNTIHIVDIRETVKGLLRAKRFLAQVVAKGNDVLFVGTKRQARHHIREHATRVDMPFVAERWLGGTLTNFKTIRSRVGRLEELETAEADGSALEYSKKMIASRSRELRKIRRNLEGIRGMSRMPGALVVIDVRREKNAVCEAKSLGIPTVCLIDTDSDPDFADIPIPGNDDAMAAIDVVLNHLANAVAEGKRARPVPPRRSEPPQTIEVQRSRGSRPRRRESDEKPPQLAGAAATDLQDQHGPGDALDPDFVVAWDPAAMSPSDYTELISILGELARANKLVGVKRIDSEGFGVPETEGALV